MSFFEVEFPRIGLAFQRLGGPSFNTSLNAVQSGQEQRNRAWANPRAEYSASNISTSDTAEKRIALVDDIRTFFYMVGGMSDGFRFFDELDYQATNESLSLISGSNWQLQRTYSLGGRTYVRAITKPIGPGASNYKGVAFAESVVVNPAGGTVSAIDHTTGIVSFSANPTGTPSASFQYHIPVRFTSDKFEPQIERSAAQGKRLIRWNSLGLIEVLPPNY